MATILNIHGYITMRDCLDEIRRYVEVCAYKALCAAASPDNDPNDESWYPAFLDEERKIKEEMERILKEAAKTNQEVHPDRPIPLRSSGSQSPQNRRKVETDSEGFILNCKDLDMQAFMKVFFFRKSYREKVVETFGIVEKRIFRKTCDELITYRNAEFAHKPVEEAEKELAGLTPEQEQELIDQYNQNIALFFKFLRFFPKFSAEPGATEDQSYYNRAHSRWCEANKKLHMEEVELETVIRRENLAINVQTLEDICEKCGIPVFILDGKHLLITDDYNRTVKPICAMAQVLLQSDIDQFTNAEIKKELEKARAAARISQSKMESELEISRAKESSNRKHFGTVIGLCVAFIGILVILLLALLGRDNGDNSGITPPNNQVQQGQQNQSGNNVNDSNSGDNSNTGDDLIPDYDGPAFISGTGSYAGLTFQVNQMKAAGILINYTNTDTCDYCLGWVGGSQVDVKTSVGTFTVSTGDGNQKLLHNSSGAFSVNMGQELMGKVLSITVRDINPLSASGLPHGKSCTIEIPIQEGNPTSPNGTANKFIRGQVEHGGLKLTVDQKLSGGIRVQYENDDTEAYSLGWVQMAKVTIKTSDGNVEGAVAENSYKIEKGATGTFVIEASGEITGTVEEIVIHNVNVLTSGGLPDFMQKDGNITIPITQTEE